MPSACRVGVEQARSATTMADYDRLRHMSIKQTPHNILLLKRNYWNVIFVEQLQLLPEVAITG